MVSEGSTWTGPPSWYGCPECPHVIGRCELTIETEPFRPAAGHVVVRVRRRAWELELMDHIRIRHPSRWLVIVAQMSAARRAREADARDQAHDRREEAGL